MTVVRIKHKQDTTRAFRLVVVLRKLAEAVDHQDELSVVELHGAMRDAAETYESAHWDRMWRLAGFDGPADAEVIGLVLSMLRDFTEGKAS